MFDREGFVDRLKDEKYAPLIAAMIDEFFSSATSVTVGDVVIEAASQDMVETIMQHAAGYEDKTLGVVTGFMLGVFLAHRGTAIFPDHRN